jgi:hypothetical protein
LILFTAVNAPRYARDFSPSSGALSQLKEGLKAKPSKGFVVPTKFDGPLESLQGELPSETKLEVVYFARQDKNKDMLSYGHRLLPEVSDSFVELSNGSPRDLRLDFGLPAQHILRIGDDRWVLLHWFVIGSTSTGSVYAAKAIRLFNLIRGQGDHSFSVVIGRKITGEQSSTVALLRSDAVLISNAFKQLSLK